MPRGGPVFRHQVVKPTARTKDTAITASSRIYASGLGTQKLRKVGERSQERGWQSELWNFYDIVPEFRFGCDWVGNLLSRAKLYVVGPDGKETNQQDALDALASLFGGPEGQEEMLRLLGINFTVAGEAWIIGEPDDSSGTDDWRVAAACEVYEEAAKLKVEGEVLGEDAMGVRLWKAHPRISTQSNSPSRAVMPTLGQIVKLGQVIDAQADSRLTGNGILFIPQEIELPSIPVTQNDGEDNEQVTQITDAAGSVTHRLINIAKVAMVDRDSAAAQIPLVLAAEGQYLEKIQHIDLWTAFDEHAGKLRDECVRRLAIGMDMPPEVLTGTAEVNHWGAWQIEEAAIKAHTEPLLGVITASITTGYLRPYLEAMGVKDFDQYSIEADTAALRLRPNRSKESLELHDRGILSRKTTLIENGFDPEVDLMDDKEYQEWMLRKVASGSTTPDLVAGALNMLGIRGIEAPEPSHGETQEARPVRSLVEHPRRAEPEEDPSTIAAAAAFVVDGLVLATEQMVYRALERAGNRLKAKVGRDLTCAATDLYMSVPSLSASEAEDLLRDAWASVDRFDYPVDKGRLRDVLNDFTLILLRTQKPYSREALSRHLLLELSDAA